MRDIQLIAKREYLERIRGKAFKITTILIPVIFGVVIAISVLAGKYSGSGKHFVVAANNATLAQDMRAQLLADKDADLQVDVLAPATDSDRQKLVDRSRRSSSTAISGSCRTRTATPPPFTPDAHRETSRPQAASPTRSTEPSSSSNSPVTASPQQMPLPSPKALRSRPARFATEKKWTAAPSAPSSPLTSWPSC